MRLALGLAMSALTMFVVAATITACSVGVAPTAYRRLQNELDGTRLDYRKCVTDLDEERRALRATDGHGCYHTVTPPEPD